MAKKKGKNELKLMRPLPSNHALQYTSADFLASIETECAKLSKTLESDLTNDGRFTVRVCQTGWEFSQATLSLGRGATVKELQARIAKDLHDHSVRPEQIVIYTSKTKECTHLFDRVLNQFPQIRTLREKNIPAPKETEQKIFFQYSAWKNKSNYVYSPTQPLVKYIEDPKKADKMKEEIVTIHYDVRPYMDIPDAESHAWVEDEMKLPRLKKKFKMRKFDHTSALLLRV